MSEPIYSDCPDWNRLRDSVIEKINVLALAWEGTAKHQPELHQQMARDLYVPAIKLLAEFCSCIEIEMDK